MDTVVITIRGQILYFELLTEAQWLSQKLNISDSVILELVIRGAKCIYQKMFFSYISDGCLDRYAVRITAGKTFLGPRKKPSKGSSDCKPISPAFRGFCVAVPGFIPSPKLGATFRDPETKVFFSYYVYFGSTLFAKLDGTCKATCIRQFRGPLRDKSG